MTSENEGFRPLGEFVCEAILPGDLNFPNLPENKNCTGNTAVDLIRKLLEALDRREADYHKAMNENYGEVRVSFAARAAEVGVFRTDLEMLLERLEKNRKIFVGS